MDIVILQADQFQYGRAHISVIRPGGAINSTLVNPLADVTHPGRGDLVLNIAVVPGEALTCPRRNGGARGRRRASRRGSPRGSKEEPVRVSERREGGRAER